MINNNSNKTSSNDNTSNKNSKDDNNNNKKKNKNNKNNTSNKRNNSNNRVQFSGSQKNVWGISCQAACLMTTPAMALVLDYSAVRLRQKMASEDSKFATELLAEVLQDMMVEVLMPIAIGLIGIVSGRKTGGVICEVACLACHFLCFLFLILGMWLPSAPEIPDFQSLPVSTGGRCLILSICLAVECSILWKMYGLGSMRWA